MLGLGYDAIEKLELPLIGPAEANYQEQVGVEGAEVECGDGGFGGLVFTDEDDVGRALKQQLREITISVGNITYTSQAYHGRLFHARIQGRPFHILRRRQLPNMNIPPLPPSKLGGVSRGRRVIQQVLHRNARDGSVSPARRGRPVAELLGEALAMGAHVDVRAREAVAGRRPLRHDGRGL